MGAVKTSSFLDKLEIAVAGVDFVGMYVMMGLVLV